jgi:TRAP-type C4-dicarboxylate transport system permease small subunit
MQNYLLAGSDTNPEITNPVLGPAIQNLSGVDFFATFLPKAVGLILVIGVVVFFFMLLVGGVQWISSGGDKAALESARGKLSNALIGLVILLASFAVIKLVEGFFGVDILQLDIGALKIE